MVTETSTQFSGLLRFVSDALDISESRYRKAEEHYQAVGKWLSKEDSPLSYYSPDIYPQGSFRLGTVIKPVSDEDEYDIDLVCQLNISKLKVTQQTLKKMIGDRLRANEAYAQMLDTEGRRCWTLNYADGSKFHMDVLPAIPDSAELLIALGVPVEYAKHAICITDKVTWNYDRDWPRSNPKGYAEWFGNRMLTILTEEKRIVAAERGVKIDDVPDFSVKTPLQRAIQILKRHRDMKFQNDPDNKPISIIITTLAARAYNNERDLFDALSTIVDGMPKYIETVGDVHWVANPVNPKENFADKWQTNPRRAEMFKVWLRQVKVDLNTALNKRGINEISESLKAAFGERTLNTAVMNFGDSYRSERVSGKLMMAAGTGTLGIVGSTKVKDHTFYGK